MRSICLLWLCCTCFTAHAQSTYKGIKQISVFTKSKTDKSPALEYEMFFDKQGNKTKYHHPTHYCTMEWDYNAQNKPTKYEIMCGESMGNGTTAYTYTPKVNIAKQGTGMYERVTTDSLDAQGNTISQTAVLTYTEDGKEAGNTNSYVRTVFTYNAKKQLASETSLNEKKEKTVTNYLYAKNDSLKYIIRDKDTLLIQDFQRDSGKKASKRYPISLSSPKSSEYYSEIYRYDEKGRLYTYTRNIRNANDCPNPKSPCAIEMLEYIYKNDQLFQTTQTFYTKGAVNTYTITLYSNGIEREKKTYNAQNEFIEHSTYKIQKW